ncbi:hypothetical protein [Hymenobacter sp. AT01-02]|uniref:hypothetical protein n=1 Tax=Hymenobacter sp. AT01-02 TaxID=1571877 RepID=UPI000A4B1755|nr:hypothetical protein [Hymenobacter sp. AT01-02]
MPLRKLAHLILLALGIVTGLAIFFVAQLRFNYNFNDFYPAGDPDLDYYQQYSGRFGNDNDYVLLGLEAPAGQTVFEPQFLTRLIRSRALFSGAATWCTLRRQPTRPTQ